MNLPVEKGSLLVLVLDVWDFHGSALSVALKSILNRRPPRPSMLVVINKADLLPSTVKQERVLSWARKELRKAAAAAVTLNLPTLDSRGSLKSSNITDGRSSDSLSSNPLGYAPPPRRGRSSDIFARDDGKESSGSGGIVGVRLVSAQKGWGMFTLLDEIEELHKGRDIFVIGAPNVGKSSVINALLSRRWNLPWTAAGKPRLSPHERSSSSSLGHSKTVTVFVDELPEGHKLGDKFTGDINELKAKVKERATLRSTMSGGRGEHGEEERSNLGDPVKRRGEEYGSSAPINIGAVSADEDALTTAALAEYRAKKARHKSHKDEGIILPEDDTIATRTNGSSDSTSSSSTPSNTIVTLSSSSSTPNSPRASTRVTGTAHLPPEIPFTTSPLPGTTLGVIGAPFDSAGNAFLYDTPGIIGDPHKQRLLEGIAWEVEAARLAEEARERRERLEKGDKKRGFGSDRNKRVVGGGHDTVHDEGSTDVKEADNFSSFPPPPSSSSTSSLSPAASLPSSLSVLSLLVPSKKPSLQLIRLRPGRCMYLAGLARIEWSHPDPNCHILLTVCVSSGLSVHVTSSERADQAFSIASAFDSESLLSRQQQLPTLEKDGLARGLGAAATVVSSNEAANKNTTATAMTNTEIAELAKTSGLSRILWPRWGALTQTARLRLIDCISSSTEKNSINKLLDSDRLATNTSTIRVGSLAAREKADEMQSGEGSERITSGGFESFLTLDSEDDEEEEDSTMKENAVKSRSTLSSSSRSDESEGDGEESLLSRRRLPPHAVMPGASRLETAVRRRARQRRALADVALSGLGWIAITPIEIEGQTGWARTVGHGTISVKSALGVSIQLRAPLLPFEAAGTKPKDWKESGTT